jgi:hypothetical protein
LAVNGLAFQTAERFADAFSALMPRFATLHWFSTHRPVRSTTRRKTTHYLTPPFFEALQRSAELFLLELWRGSWEVYPSERSRVNALTMAGVHVEPVSSDRWPRRGFE